MLLASASPRRVELLRQLGLEFSVLPVDIDETWDGTEPAGDHAERLAREKAQAGRACHPDRIALGADTIVVVDGHILGKPRNRRQAAEMLALLSGRTHQVYSAVALAAATLQTALNVTAVTFRELAADEIDGYLATGEADDKAGAYAIQGRAAAFVIRIEGSYSGVMGLPLFETAELLRRAGLMPAVSAD
ncbi:MAG: septum formation inhibitor Maf [Gammaproteobacteria bacterium]|nr:septum formation inhibitor Maf [Gammaproteobacteria bacterium]